MINKIILFATFVLLLFLFRPGTAHCQSATKDSLLFSRADSTTITQPQNNRMEGYYYRVFVVTGIIILIIFIGLNIYKKKTGNLSTVNKQAIKIIARRSIGPKQYILLAIIDGRKFALGVTDQSVNKIADLGEASSAEIEASEKQIENPLSFLQVLTKVKNKS